MFLRCSYFFVNLSLNVLINMVLTQKNRCIVKAFKRSFASLLVDRPRSTVLRAQQLRSADRQEEARFTLGNQN